MPHALEWHVSATYDSQEQAKQAAAMVVAMGAREYEVTAFEDGRKVWTEVGFRPGAVDVRV